MTARAWRGLLLSAWFGTGAAVAQPSSEIDPASLHLAPDRYIVAGIDNPPALSAARAGSSPRGYDVIGTYGPSPRALRLLQAVEKDYGLIEVGAWAIQPLHMHCAVLQIASGQDRDALLAAMARDPRVRLAQPLQTFQTRTQGYNDPYVGLQSGFHTMDVADAHAMSRGEGIRIAVVDTGADVNHPDLRERIAKTVNVVDHDERQFIRDRHGTEVAGIIAAAANNRQGIVGVAPAARLVLIKACWQLHEDADPATCNSFTLARGLVAALDAGAQVVNLSLAGPSDPLLRSLIEAGLQRGVLFVGAAPAGIASATDGFLDRTGAIEVASLGSPRQADARLYAPGREILTLLPGGRYDFASGASLATAHVTGAVALILAHHPRTSAATMQRLLQQSGDGFVQAGGEEIRTGVDACAALAASLGGGHCRHPDPSSGRIAGAH